jgi:hypothetical protein
MEMGAARSIVCTINSDPLSSIQTSDGISTIKKLSRASRLRWTQRNANQLRRPSVIPALFASGICTQSTSGQNHVHTGVSIGLIKPERALNAFKANATRHMRQDDCWRHDYSPWAEKSSKRYLWNERSVERAIDYVLYGQGDELPDFDEE